MDCAGLNSCLDLDFSDAIDSIEFDEIRGMGLFSLQNSKIYSTENATNDFVFYGWYSGYNTNIYCQSNHTCLITCKNNGCKGLNAYCNDCSNLSIDCDESNGNLCANTNYSSNQDELGLDLFELFDEYYWRNYSIGDIYDNNLFGCNSNSDYISCNDYLDADCKGQNINIFKGKSVCCRGVHSCRSSTITAQNGANIHCLAANSCSLGIINGPSPGNSSISENNITVECGVEGCDSAAISNIDNVVSVGHGGLNSAMVENAQFVGCFSWNGCVDSDLINVKKIYATGYRGLYSANINNTGLNSFEIYLLGYDSGNSLNITCNNILLDECFIYCYNQETCSNLGTVDCNCQMINLTGLFLCLQAYFGFCYSLATAQN